MLKRISDYFYSISSGWLALTGLAVFVLFMIFVLPQQAQKAEAYTGGTSPDTSYFYSAEDLYRMADQFGADGRTAYICARFTFDLVFPLVYLFFLTTTVSWSLAQTIPSQSQWRLLNLFPLASATFDYLENITTSLVMTRYPTPTPIIVSIAPVFTSIKWDFVNGSFITLLIGLFLIGWKWIRR